MPCRPQIEALRVLVQTFDYLSLLTYPSSPFVRILDPTFAGIVPFTSLPISLLVCSKKLVFRVQGSNFSLLFSDEPPEGGNSKPKRHARAFTLNFSLCVFEL